MEGVASFQQVQVPGALLAHALVRVDIGLAVGTSVGHILEVVYYTRNEAAA